MLIQETITKCQECGTINDNDAKFCKECGLGKNEKKGPNLGSAWKDKPLPRNRCFKCGRHLEKYEVCNCRAIFTNPAEDFRKLDIEC